MSAFDMALTQSAFVSAVSLHPSYWGLARASEAELESYVFFWRCVCFQLGLHDRFNLCGGGRDVANRISSETMPWTSRPPATPTTRVKRASPP